MSIVNNDNISVITTQSGENGIMFKNYLFGLKRTNKNGNEIWICIHKLCNASITMREGLVVKTSSIKPDGSHEFQHQQKMDVNGYQCIRSIKRRIDEDPATPVSLLYLKILTLTFTLYLCISSHNKSKMHFYGESHEKSFPKKLPHYVDILLRNMRNTERSIIMVHLIHLICTRRKL